MSEWYSSTCTYNCPIAVYWPFVSSKGNVWNTEENKFKEEKNEADVRNVREEVSI